MQRWGPWEAQDQESGALVGGISTRVTEAPSSLPLPSGGDTAGIWPPTTKGRPPRPGSHADLGLPASQVRLAPPSRGVCARELPAPRADPVPAQPLTPCSAALGLGRTGSGGGVGGRCRFAPPSLAAQPPRFHFSSPAPQTVPNSAASAPVTSCPDLRPGFRAPPRSGWPEPQGEVLAERPPPSPPPRPVAQSPPSSLMLFCALRPASPVVSEGLAFASTETGPARRS